MLKNRGLCDRDSVCKDDPLSFQDQSGEQVIRNFLARQIAGFSADAALPAMQPVPESQTWTMLMTGLVGLGYMARRRKP